MGQPSGTVTLLFTDVGGSTALWESHHAQMQQALARHDDLVRSAIEGSGGYVFKTVGDAFCATFADAEAGVGAAIEAQKALAAEVWPEQVSLRVRMALHTGGCQERGGDHFGPAVNRAARLVARLAVPGFLRSPRPLHDRAPRRSSPARVSHLHSP
ncbi:MAG TPA: adenylate/guanylate cyclase domain-containing protein [Acidimicrobiales bacterium]|nr:adenylate/guanylate cyclase domain-containing protein [Acidimicrobiales bacterium]